MTTKVYLKFENGNQSEVATLTTKPSGSEWKTAPANFDFSKRYRLSKSGKIEEISSDELATARFEIAKFMALKEISMLIDGTRNKYVGESASKRKSYELQEKAAISVLTDAESAPSSLIQPLAEVRNITIQEMAQLILSKAEIANQKILQLEAIEDNYEKLVKNAETSEQIAQIISDLMTTLTGEDNA
jgi:hypothetical protein